MARGDYTVQEVEAAKQAGRDSSYRTCVLTMFIFLILCIILLVIAWTTWKPASEKEADSYHSKYGGREPTSSLGTEPPFYEFEEPTTMKTHHKEHTRVPVMETTRATKTSATTKSHLIRLVALETTEAIKPTNFTTSPATTTATTTTATTATTSTVTTTTTTERPLPQREDSTYFTTPATTSSTENYLKRQVMFISSAVTTEKSLTRSDQYDTKTTTIKKPLIRLIEQPTTTSTTPVTSLDTEQPLTTTTEKTSMQMEGTSDDESVPVTITQTKQMEYTVPHVEKSDQPSSTTSDMRVHWQLRTTSMSTTDLRDATQNLENNTTPNVVQPVTSLDTEQPLTTTTEKTSMQMEGTSDDESVPVILTQTKQMEYMVPHVEKSEQPSSTTSDMRVLWQLRTTTSMSTTDLRDATQHLEYNTTPNVVHPEPETATTTEDRPLKYKTTDFAHSAESTEIAFMTESSQPDDQSTKQRLIHWLIHGKQSTDTVTSSTLHAGTDSSASFAESVTSTTVFERDRISDYSEPKIGTAKQLMLSSGSSVTETEDTVKNLTTPATIFSDSMSAIDSTSVNNQSVFTTKNESTTSHISTAAVRLTTMDRSTASFNATVDITDTESTTPMILLTSSSNSHPYIQPIYTLVTTDTSTDSTAITSTAGDTGATDSSVADIGDLSSQSISAVRHTDVSRILNTTDGPLPMSVTGPTTAAVTDSAMSTQHSLTADDETSMMSPSYKSQKIIANATVAPEQTKLCTTSACKVVASRMLSLMNHSADPCEDFYEYACGGLRENRNLLQHDPEYDIWTRIAGAMKQNNVHSPAAFRKFNNFYDQCLMFDSIVNKTSRLEEIRKVLDSVGKMYNHRGWTAKNLKLNLTSLLVKLFQLNSAPLFDVQLDVDIQNTSRFSLKLTAPSHQSKFQPESSFAARCKAQITHQDGMNVNLKDVYHNKYLPCTRDYGEYMNVTEKALKELGMFKGLEPFHESQYIKDLRFFIEFQILHHLTELPLAGEMRHNLLSKRFLSLSVADLQARYSLVDWKTLLSALVGDTLDPHTTIQLYFEGYFDSLFDKLGDSFRADNTNRMNLHNALLAMFAHDLYMDLVQTQSPCSREDYCLRVASGLLEDVSSALYLSTFTREQLNAMELELHTLFTQLKSTLKQQFQDAEWLDDSSRSYLTSKLQKLTAVTDGGRVFLGDSYILNQRLLDVDMYSSNSYLQNAVQLVRRYRSGMYSLYGTEPNLTDTVWSHFLLPYDTQAVAVYQLNIVVIPFGLIGFPQSTRNLPEYIFKARFGNDLARQIAHHFDAVGIEYGSSGKDMDLLSDITKPKYDTIRECDENAYSFEKSWTNHKREVFTYQVDASQSMNERFADSSALQLSYKTYKRNAVLEPLLPWLDMNHDKLYHMLVAQEFCTKGGMLDYTIQLFESEQMPPFLRVTNMAQNSEAFSEAYGCGRGTQMNPEFKCSSFPELEEIDGYSSSLSPY